MSSTSTEAAAVAAAIRAINDAWVAGRAEEAGERFHDHIVMVMPGYERRVRGRRAIVQSYADFTAAATVEHFEQSDVEVDIVGDTAFATYTFKVRYAMGGARHEGTGREVWCFARAGDGWTGTWRLMTDVHERQL